MVAKEDFVHALRTSVEAFHQMRRQHPVPDLDLAGADLSGCNLRGAQLGRLDLRGASFRNADLTGANLGHSDLRGADFQGATLVDVNLHKAELEGSNFLGAALGGFEQEGRMCLNRGMFCGVRWGREQLEYFLGILNQNDDWEVQYQIVPKRRN